MFHAVHMMFDGKEGRPWGDGNVNGASTVPVVQSGCRVHTSSTKTIALQTGVVIAVLFVHLDCQVQCVSRGGTWSASSAVTSKAVELSLSAGCGIAS